MQIVRAFYRDLNGRDFRAAWNLLNPRYQHTLEFDEWVAVYQLTHSVELSSLSTAAQDETHATVNVSIKATYDTDAGPQTTEYQGTWELVFTEGSWKLDRPTIGQVS